MSLKNNPIYGLASDLARGVLSREEAFSQTTNSEFLKRLRNKHFDEVIGATYKVYSDADSEPVPPELTGLALECAQHRGLQSVLRGMLNLAHGMISVEKGNYDTAQEYAARAKRILQNSGSPDIIGICDTVLIESCTFAGNDEMLKAIKVSAQHLLAKSGSSDYATMQLRLANTFSAIGDQERALQHFRNAKSHFIKLTRSNTHYRMAFSKALKRAHSAFENYLFLHVPNIITCDMGISSCNFALGKYDEGIEYLISAKKRCERHGMIRTITKLNLLQAVAYRELGDYQSAKHILETAYGCSNASDMLQFRVQLFLTSIYLDMERYDSAISFLEKIRQTAEHEGRVDRVAECERKLAEICLKIGNTDKASDLLVKAREAFSSKRMEFHVQWCNFDLAWAYAESGQYEQALEIFRQIKSVNPQRELLSEECLHGSGYVLWKMGRLQEARQEYASSINIIEQMRQGSSHNNWRSSVLESKRRVYEEMIELCLDLNDCAAALEYVEKLKSRSLAEMLEGRNISPKNASPDEIEQLDRLRFRLRAVSHSLTKDEKQSPSDDLLAEFYEAQENYRSFLRRMRQKDPSFDPDQSVDIAYRDIQAVVNDPGTALIEFFPMANKTAAFLVLYDRRMEETTLIINHYTQSDLEHDLKAVQNKDLLEDTLRRLYNQLFAPIKPYLHGIKNIVFVPYSGLHLIPLHAMYNEEDGSKRYLIDDYVITYAPSAKVLKQCLNVPRHRNNEAFVATANPKKDLPHAGIEAESVARLLNAPLHRRVCRKDIETKARNSDVLHFTGHADGNALCLHGESGEQDEYRYDVGDIFVKLDLPESWLVTLSVCETGRIRPGKTDEYVGLPSAFLHAGAASVICSLWRVSDASTTLLMQKMYQEIARGIGKAEALRNAQLWLRDANRREEHLAAFQLLEDVTGKGKVADSVRFRRKAGPVKKILPEDLHKPYYWAGFICTGAP